MKILIDAMGATQFAGGMTLHAREIILSWREEFPQDQLTVVAGPSLADYLSSYPDISVVRWQNESVIWRSPGQLLVTYLTSLRKQADAVISLSPIVSPLVSARKSACFQHDWRHLKNPEEFSLLNKIYRKLWVLSAKTAGINFCISDKAAEETLEVAPSARTIVVENGRDHARRWEHIKPTDQKNPYLITFGHHNNKRPEMTIEALSLLPEEFAHYKLVVLGARGQYAQELQALAQAHGVLDRIIFPGFVEDPAYEELISASSVLVMASSDEGFGLPAAESEYFGIPTVVTSDSGMQTIFDGLFVADPNPSALAQQLEAAIRAGVSQQGAADQWSWAKAVRAIRTSLPQAGA